jgi:hypothetical protein
MRSQGASPVHRAKRGNFERRLGDDPRAQHQARQDLALASGSLPCYKRSVESSAWQPDFESFADIRHLLQQSIKTSEIDPGHGVCIRGQRSSKGFGVFRKNLHKIFL